MLIVTKPMRRKSLKFKAMAVEDGHGERGGGGILPPPVIRALF